MSLINCPECNKLISDKASSCPNCGYPISLRPDEKSMADRLVVNDDSVNFSSKRQKRNKISKQTATILILAATIMAVCAAGTLYGIHRHKVKILAAQKAELQRQMEEEELARQKAIEDSIARVNFQTPDLKMVGAHGPVKSVVYDDDGEDVILHANRITFGEDGFIEKIVVSDNYELLVKRNSKKLIERLQSSSDHDIRYAHYQAHYTYGEDDYIKQCSYSAATDDNCIPLDVVPKWDETGKVSKMTFRSLIDDFDFKTTVTCKYPKADKYGNWIECEKITTVVLYKKGEHGERLGDKTETKTITRTIEYYE